LCQIPSIGEGPISRIFWDCKSTQRNFLSYLEGTSHSWISLLERRRDIMLTLYSFMIGRVPMPNFRWKILCILKECSYPLPSYTLWSIHVLKSMITLASQGRMGKAHGCVRVWGRERGWFPKWRAGLGLILGPLFWESPGPRGFTYT